MFSNMLRAIFYKPVSDYLLNYISFGAMLRKMIVRFTTLAVIVVVSAFAFFHNSEYVTYSDAPDPAIAKQKQRDEEAAQWAKWSKAHPDAGVMEFRKAMAEEITSSDKHQNTEISPATKDRSPVAQEKEASTYPEHSTSKAASAPCEGNANGDCIQEQFAAADKHLNDLYRSTMSSLDEERKTNLKREQIKWIKHKESTCVREDKSAQTQCQLQLTVDRIAYLNSYK